ncbi:MAG: hypothetical protein JWM78_1798 [Verrucomicrobiaceae bacterium]|nr:hypothetical protein [Verrucomicrobiaceae bacterium]
MTNRLFQRCSLLLLAVFLVACAQSPQRINVQPTLSISSDSIGSGRTILVSGSDQRQSKVLGSLGGVYGNSATLTVGNNIEQALTNAANALLASQGYVVNSPDPSALQLTIVVENLTYQPQEQAVGNTVKLSAVLRADVSKRGETFSGRYQSDSERRSVTKPDQEENEKYVNELLSDTLVRMFSDNRLRDFLLK